MPRSIILGRVQISSGALIFEMGKAKKRNSHGSAARKAADSVTAVSIQESQMPNLGGKGGQQVDMKSGVLEGLTSLNTLTRESSCAAIASLFEKIDVPKACRDSWAAAQRLIAGGVIKKLLPRLLDRAPGVKIQATGAMRNISAVRDPRVCEIMVQDDCLTPVLTLLDRMSSNPVVAATAGNGISTSGQCEGSGEVGAEDPGSNKPGVITPQQETIIISQLVATLCNLLAAVDVAVARFTKQGGLSVVMKLLQEQECRGNAEIFGGALQALHISTDSNTELTAQLASLPGAVDQITALVRGVDVPYVKISTSIRVQAAGVLVNVAGLAGNAAQSASAQGELSRVVLPLLLEQMTYDPSTLLQACVALSSVKLARGEGDMDVDGDGEGHSADGIGEKSSTNIQETSEATEVNAGAQVASAVAASSLMQVEPSGAVNSEGVARAGDASDGGGPPEGGGANQPDMDAEIRWGWKLRVAEPLKLTAEVMTNLCSLAAAAEEDEEEEQEWGSDDEDTMEKQAVTTIDGDGDAHRQHDATGSTPTVLLDAMADGGALQRVLGALKAILSPTPRDLKREAMMNQADDMETESMPAPPARKVAGDGHLPLPSGTAGDLADLRATVALCAANLVQNLPLKALGADPYALWVDLCSMCEAAAERAPSCVETLTGVMWGVVRRAGPAIASSIGLATSSTGTTVDAAIDPLPLLLRLCDPEKTRAFESRVNAVGMLGTLGSSISGLMGKQGGLGIGRALVRMVEDPHVLVQAEALNALMDLYGDDNRDAAFRASGAPSALAMGVPAFRKKVKQEGKALGRDALCHLKETALNAVRFVKYKKVNGGGATVR